MKEKRKVMEKTCHGCKWLDEMKSLPAGSGYCAHVVRSKGYHTEMKVRRPEKGRCELYEEGSFETRFAKGDSECKLPAN